VFSDQGAVRRRFRTLAKAGCRWQVRHLADLRRDEHIVIDVPEANQERAELRKGGYRGVLLHLGANDRDPPLEGAFAEASIPPAEYCADTPRATPVVGGSP
jgi:hypothetical protein